MFFFKWDSCIFLCVFCCEESKMIVKINKNVFFTKCVCVWNSLINACIVAFILKMQDLRIRIRVCEKYAATTVIVDDDEKINFDFKLPGQNAETKAKLFKKLIKIK